MNEIGSEFEFETAGEGKQGLQGILPLLSDSLFVFSGRTALEVVLCDIGNRVKKALLPSYCCDSMLEPFRRAGVEIAFYDVNMHQKLNIDINIPSDCDVVLWCNYFGFNIKYPQREFAEFSNRGGIIIEDITHSLFSRNQYGEESHYLVASLRKWGAVLSGGFVAKKKGFFLQKTLSHPCDEFVATKLSAMKKKSEYLAMCDSERTIELKKEFLQLFSESNHFFAEKYHMTGIDSLSQQILSDWDVDSVRNKRIENAKVLYNGLSGLKCIKPLFSVDEMDCPLFVPVVTMADERDSIVAKLAENGIYCPRHWPHPKADCVSNLYDTEISLICDQRYNAQDMERIVNVILNEV